MNVYVYSADEYVIKHFKALFAENQNRIFYFSCLSDLQNALENAEPLLLLFHLNSLEQDATQNIDELEENLEAELAALQHRYKDILNTLVLTNNPYPEQGVRLLALNVRGYANTYLDSHKLEMAINVIQQGEMWLGSSLVNYMLGLNQQAHSRDPVQDETVNPNAVVFKTLSEREQQIAQKILAGMQNKLIAAELGITERTVKAHLTAIYKKLNVRNRLELTLKLQQADRRERRERRKIS